ncbi:MAG: transporter substrate-binding domain-containing protein [Acidobacteria bacterium]|nr:transporter substrate-binding domain-containing protein [Acidobacteriota bacterium]
MNIRQEIKVIVVATSLLFVIVFGQSCATNPQPGNQAAPSEPQAGLPETATEEQPPAEIDSTLLERLRTEKWTGDIDGMVERRYLRALVLYSKTGFFYDGPQPRGISYEGLKEFEKFLNKRLNTGNKPVQIVFLPVTREEGLKRMAEGRGDIAVANIPIVDEILKIADLSDPVRENAKQLVVTGPSAPPIAAIDDLAGKEIFVRKLSRYYPTLVRLNEQFKQSGKPEMTLKLADENLQDEDILNMVGAGVVGMTLMDDLVAGLWAKVFEGLNVHNDLALVNDDRIGWAVQKNTPQFLALVNEFVKDHKEGTSFGNTLILRYAKDAKFAKNNTLPGEMEKYKAAVGLFKKYGDQYGFDWLMIAAQAYQESTIDQSKTSPAGAYGVMQIKPSTAAGNPINIPDIDTNMENNINAGVKYLDYIVNVNFKDAKFDKLNRELFAFAAYNAGPARVAGLRKKAEAQGLDPNKWFNNVELVAAKEIGAETVTYVSNIYKYYVAYKLVSDDIRTRKPRNNG